MKRVFPFLRLILIALSYGQKKEKKLGNLRVAFKLYASQCKEAYIYGFPMLDYYRVRYEFYQDSANKEFNAPWNHIGIIARVFTYKNIAVQTMNYYTPFS